MKKISILFLLLLMFIAGCESQPKQQEEPLIEPIVELAYTDGASFVIQNVKNQLGENVAIKVIPRSEWADDQSVIDWYLDPQCPSCVKLEEIMNPRLNELLDSGLQVRFHTLAFLSPKSVDDYSLRASTYIVAIAEHYPDKAFNFMKSILTFDTLPEISQETPDETFKALALQAGLNEDEWNVVVNDFEFFQAIVKAETAKAFNDETLLSKGKDNRITVPFVIIGTSEKALDFTTTLDAEAYFMEQVESYVKVLNNPNTISVVKGFEEELNIGDTLSFTVESAKEETVKVFLKSMSDEVEILLENGSYSITIEEKHKNGAVVLVNVYDKDNKLIKEDTVSLKIANLEIITQK